MIDLTSKSEKNEYYEQALLLAEIICRILKKRGDIDLSKSPSFDRTNIVQFRERMRVTSLEKFDESTYISAVTFCHDDEDEKNRSVLGTLIIYIVENYMTQLFTKLGYPDIDEDDPDLLENACGTFCNLVGGKFKEGLETRGYEKLLMSPFITYRNSVPMGIEYPTGQKLEHVISFEIQGEKRIVAELVMDPLKKVK